MAGQRELFPEGELAGSRPAKLDDVQRKENRHRRMLARVNAVLLRTGWRLSIEGAVWIATRRGVELRAARATLLLRQVEAFTRADEEPQLGLWRK